MASLIRKQKADIRRTLVSFGVGDTLFAPFKDGVNEKGEKVEGSYTETRVWRSRYRTLIKEGNLKGSFTFRDCKVPDGTIIFRAE